MTTKRHRPQGGGILTSDWGDTSNAVPDIKNIGDTHMALHVGLILTIIYHSKLQIKCMAKYVFES